MANFQKYPGNSGRTFQQLSKNLPGKYTHLSFAASLQSPRIDMSKNPLILNQDYLNYSFSFSQLVVGILFVVIGSLNINRKNEQTAAIVLNDVIVVLIFIISLMNVIISGFGIEHSSQPLRLLDRTRYDSPSTGSSGLNSGFSHNPSNNPLAPIQMSPSMPQNYPDPLSAPQTLIP